MSITKLLRRATEEVEYFFLEYGARLTVGAVSGVLGAFIGMAIAKLIGIL